MAILYTMVQFMGSSYRCIVACAHLGNGQGCRTATMVAPLPVTSGPVRYEAVLQSCGTSPVAGGGGWYRLVTGCTHGDFIHQADGTMT